jgi:hypothetical protein
MESAYCGKDKGKWIRDWKGKEMKGVQRGKHEELEKVDGKLIRVADSGNNWRTTKLKVYRKKEKETVLDPPLV